MSVDVYSTEFSTLILSCSDCAVANDHVKRGRRKGEAAKKIQMQTPVQVRLISRQVNAVWGIPPLFTRVASGRYDLAFVINIMFSIPLCYQTYSD
jgi:hypothetical protein